MAIRLATLWLNRPSDQARQLDFVYDVYIQNKNILSSQCVFQFCRITYFININERPTLAPGEGFVFLLSIQISWGITGITNRVVHRKIICTRTVRGTVSLWSHLRELHISEANKRCINYGFKIGIHISFSTYIPRSVLLERGIRAKVWEIQNIDYIKSYFGKLASRNANVAWSKTHNYIFCGFDLYERKHVFAQSSQTD